MNNIVVYTAITGGRETLLENQCWGDADWICFSDKKWNNSRWTVLSAYDKFKDSSRNAKIHKVLSHLFLRGYAYSIWMDGNFELIVPPEELVNSYLNGYDIATFLHPKRKTVAEEVKILFSISKYKEEWFEIAEQEQRYKETGHLRAGGFLLRKNNTEIEIFERAWWAEICRFSKRDQLSLSFAIEDSPVGSNMIPGNIFDNKYFRRKAHYDWKQRQ
ncbi:DUF616 domain-containing protein [Candidatus Woesearchaeota archaeon]|nr:DUF616 domain-containing protein [Candidatus Woesearchaeota archaeon]